MDYNNFENSKRNFKQNMHLLPQYYGLTSQNSFSISSPMFLNKNSESKMINKMMTDPVINDFNRVFGSDPIISHKTFKNYQQSHTNTVNPPMKRGSDPLHYSVPNNIHIDTNSSPEIITIRDRMFQPFSAFTNFFTGILNNFTAVFPRSRSLSPDVHISDESTRCNISSETCIDASNGLVKDDHSVKLEDHMGDIKTIRADSSLLNNDKKDGILDQCQNTSVQYDVMVNNGETVEVALQSNHSAVLQFNTTSYSVKQLEKDILSHPTNSEVISDVLSLPADVIGTDLNSEVKQDESYPYCDVTSDMNHCRNTGADEVDFCPSLSRTISDTSGEMTERRWHRTRSLNEEIFKSDLAEDEQPPLNEKLSTSRFILSIRQKAAESNKNESKTKIVEKEDSVLSCEDKLAKLKALLSSSKRRSYSTDISPLCTSEVRKIKQSNIPAVSLSVLHNDNITISTDTDIIDKKSEKNVACSVDELEKMLDKLSLNENKEIKKTFTTTDTEFSKTGIKCDNIETSCDVNESCIKCIDFHHCLDINKTDTMLEPVQMNSLEKMEENFHFNGNNKVDDNQFTKGCIGKSNNINNSLPLVIDSDQAIIIKSDNININEISKQFDAASMDLSTIVCEKMPTYGQNSEALCDNLHMIPDKTDVKNTKMNNDHKLHVNSEEVVLEPNTNHSCKEFLNSSTKSKRSKILKNHRLSATKFDENNVHTAEISNIDISENNGSHERLSPVKEHLVPHSKICSKRHKNEHCIKKHRHKDRQSFKKDIRDDLNFDNELDISSPIYFSPDTLELHDKNKLKKNIRKKGKRQKNKRVPKTNVEKCKNKLTERVEKCVNFISNLPSQLSPNICRNNQNNTNIQKNRLSSTDSEECLGFDEIKGKFKRTPSECESDDSFIIVFSDPKRDDHSVQHNKNDSVTIVNNLKNQSGGERMSRARIPSECDSEDSFVICFETDGNISADDCYGNDDIYSDTDSMSSPSDVESENETDESTTESSGYGEDCTDETCLVKLDSIDELGEVSNALDTDDSQILNEVPEKKLTSCLKKKPERSSPNPTTCQNAEKKVTFNPASPKVHKMVVWSHAYRQARIGPWERYGRDAERFRQRIRDTSVVLEWVFKREHRSRVFFQRFRPLLMRAAREEREQKARETKRLREEEEQRKIQIAEENERMMSEYKKIKDELNSNTVDVSNDDELMLSNSNDVSSFPDDSESINVMQVDI